MFSRTFRAIFKCARVSDRTILIYDGKHSFLLSRSLKTEMVNEILVNRRRTRWKIAKMPRSAGRALSRELRPVGREAKALNQA